VLGDRAQRELLLVGVEDLERGVDQRLLEVAVMVGGLLRHLAG